MLYWSFIFLIVAVIAAVLGFGGIAGVATNIAIALFYIFVGLFVVTLIASVIQSSRRRPLNKGILRRIIVYSPALRGLSPITLRSRIRIPAVRRFLKRSASRRSIMALTAQQAA